MKNARTLIVSLVALCVLLALVAFFLPNASGMALSYLTISVACVVGMLCVGSMFRFFLGGR
jgi:hypothetical protein